MKIYCYWELILRHVATLPQKIRDTGIIPLHKTRKYVRDIALLNPLMRTSGSERRNIGVSHIHRKHITACHYKFNFCTRSTMKQPYFPLALDEMNDFHPGFRVYEDCTSPKSLIALWANILANSKSRKNTKQPMLQYQVFI